ncbi:Aldo/keto reductase [Epithele typhae]|uniref:Aldo/keto reductase n=1 Tax=Epithele typhae TaxID=378194 RepID=UPI0020074B23|nr:Aldo/keto reductase [Epithele typhae]KAH9935129.1 Aldo/keto reductase [Epithele typhae]
MSPHTITLNDGRKIPFIGFGTGTALYGRDAEASVQRAIEVGVVHLDGAQLYGNEDSLGAAIAASGRPRDALWVTTKLGKVPEGTTVRETLVASLKKLRLEYVDLFLIHMPIHHADLAAVWRAMEECKDAGLARTIGVSNFRVQDYEKFMPTARIVPAVNQIEYHPYTAAWAAPIIEYQKQFNIVTASYGGLTPIVRKPGGPIDPVLETVRQRVERDAGKPVSAGQILGLWLKAQNVVEITTSSKVERIKEYLATETLPDLTSEEVAEIMEKGKTIHFRQFCKWLDE